MITLNNKTPKNQGGGGEFINNSKRPVFYKTSSKKAFTLVELIIVVVILAILSTIAYMGYSSYTSQARDGVRKHDVHMLAEAIELYGATKGDYPEPANATLTSIEGIDGVEWQVGTFSEDLVWKLGDVVKHPEDPSTKADYYYALSTDGNNYRILTKLEETGEEYIIANKIKKITPIEPVVSTNNLPTLTGFGGDSPVYSEIQFLVTAQIEDIDGDSVSISSNNLPDGVSISGGDISGSMDTAGTYNFDLILDDGKGTTTVNVPLYITKMPKSPGCSSSQSYGSANYNPNGWIGFDANGNYSDNGVLGVYVKNYQNYRLSEITNIINTKWSNGNYLPMSFSDGNGNSYNCYIDNNDIW